MIDRKFYLDKLIRWKHEPLIKVLTGVRRSGKSTLLDLFTEHLYQQGVKKEQIIRLNFELLENEPFQHYQALYEYIQNQMIEDKMNYVLLDEVQRVNQFEKVLDSLFLKENIDVTVTGSNAYMLSGELATLLSGRMIEIKVHPLSFAEFYSVMKNQSKEEAFSHYLTYGGFPYTTNLKEDRDFIDYMSGIINSVLIKDVLARKKRGNARLVEQLAKFLLSSSGNLISIKKIADTLTSQGTKTSSHTIQDYLDSFIEAYLFYEIERYDIDGKRYLSTQSKFYPVDTGLRRAMLGNRKPNLGSQLESVVFLELIRRGYEVYVGILHNLEVDFIATKKGVTTYYQVSYTVQASEETYRREVAPFKKIKDNYQKILLTTDSEYFNEEGVEHWNVIDWLLKDRGVEGN